jgi:hypothetical protein
MTTGCATVNYTSQKPAALVSECIANGWRKVPESNAELPVTLIQTSDYYFVDVELVQDFPIYLPMHSIWAKVWPSPPGEVVDSHTEYRRNIQIKHEKIDRVVKECQ